MCDDLYHMHVVIICCRALDEGLCGVPSFTVNNSEVVWGQDKLNVVADMLCGWETPFTPPANL